MAEKLKTKEILLKELQELQQEHNSMKDQFDNMCSIAKVGTWNYDPQSSNHTWSKEVYKIFELTDTIELNLEEALKFYTDESSGIIRKAVNLAIEEGKSFVRDSKIITALGRHKWIRIQGEVKENQNTNSKQIFGTIQDISEILLLDQVTQRSALTLDQVEQITHIGHWSVNIIDGSLYHSDEIKRIFGYEPSEYALSVEEAIDAYHPDDRDDVLKYFNRAAETGEGYEFDLRVIQPSGNIRYVHSKGYTEKNDEGKVITVYGVFQDITEIKQTEQALYKSEALKNKMVSNIGDVIVIIDQNGINQYKSPNITSFFGWKPEDLVGKSTWDNVHPDDLETAQNVIGEISTKPNAKATAEIRYRKKDGKYVWIEITVVNLLHDADIKGFLGNYKDITARKQAEIELLQAKEKAEESELQLKLIANNFVNGMLYQVALLSDTKRKFNYVSEAVIKLYGCTPEEAIQNPDLIYGKLHPDDIGDLLEKEKEALREMAIFKAESRVINPDGTIRWAYYISKPRMIDGIPYWDGIELDITERKEMEFELIQAKEKAEESERLKSSFLANMSHEIRTPMNGILGFAELLKEPDLSGKEQSNYIDIIEQSGARMLNTINNLIEISKIEADQYVVTYSDVKVNRLLNKLFEFFKPEMQKKGIQFVSPRINSQLEVLIHTDEEKLYNILVNLIRNASKYTDHGSIKFGYTKKNEYVEFFVKDTGMGIPKNYQDKIFNRFVQVEMTKTRKYEGSGLGLAIAKANIELLGGNIWFESEEDRGSKFYFTIPCTPIE